MGALRALLLATVVAALACAQPVMAAPAVDGVFNLAGVQTNGQLTVDGAGNVWVALETGVGKVQPDGTVTTFSGAQLNNAVGSPTGGITFAGGFVWISQNGGGGKETMVKFAPDNPGGATGVAVTGITAGATAVTLGPDGNVWVAIADKIVKFAPASPATTQTFTVTGLAPKAIASSSDGTLWLTDGGSGGRLLNVTTAGTTTPYPTGGLPQFIHGGPDGLMAFGNPNSTPQQIGLVKPGGTPQTLDRPNGSDPFGVAFGADGAFWIAEFAGNRLARVTTDGQLTTLTGFPVVAGQGPRQIVAGPNNTLWATLDKPGDSANAKIARITGVDPPPVVQDPGPVDPGPGPGDTPPPPPPPDTTPPLLSAATLARGLLTFTSSEAGTESVLLQRRAAGRRRGTRCVRPTPRLRRARRCVRHVRVSSVSAAAVAGINRVRLPTRKLTPGRYTVTVTVKDLAGNVSLPLKRSFTIKRTR